MTNQANEPTNGKKILAQLDEATLETGLKAALRYQNCPDSMTLNDFQAGLLTATAQTALQQHLATCADCQAALERLEAFLASEAVSPAPADQTAVSWTRVRDVEWRLREAGQLVIRFVAQSLTPPQLAPIPTKGDATSPEAETLRHTALDPNDIEDLDIELVALKNASDPETCTLNIRVAILSRWPELQGTRIQASTTSWQAIGTSDEDGLITLAGLPIAQLNHLVVEINP
jgi:hypothetical protein